MTTPNEPVFYDAALAGALGGMYSGQAGTIVSDEEVNTYTITTQDAVAFALMIDSTIGIVEGPTVAQADLLRKLCQAWWRGRNPNGQNQVDAIVPAFYNDICGAIVEAWTVGKAFLA